MRRQGSPAAASPHPAARAPWTPPPARLALDATRRRTGSRRSSRPARSPWWGPATIPPSGATSSPAGRWLAGVTARCCWSAGAASEVLGVPTHPSVQAAAAAHGLHRRPGRAVRAGRRLRGRRGRRGRGRGPGDRRDHRGTLRDRCRGSPARGRGRRDRPRRRRGAGRPELPRHHRHRDRARPGPGALPVGDVAVLSQSGNLALDLAGLMADRGLGVSRFVSVGNQADLGVVDLMAAVRGARRDPGRRGLRRGRRRRPGFRRRGPCAAGRRQAGGAARARAQRGGRAQRRLPHRIADQLLVGGRRRLRGRGSAPGGPPDPAGRPARRAASAAPDGRSPGGGPHRRWGARCRRGRGALRGGAADAVALRGGHHRARGGAVAPGDAHQPGRPRRRRRAGPRQLCAGGSRCSWTPTRSTASC